MFRFVIQIRSHVAKHSGIMELLLRLVAVAALALPASCSIYSVNFDVPSGTYKNFTEGPLFGASDAPHWFGTNRDAPVVHLHGRFTEKSLDDNGHIHAGATVSVVLSQFEERVAVGAAADTYFSGCTAQAGENGVVHVSSLDLVNGWATVNERVALVSIGPDAAPGGWTYITMAACNGDRKPALSGYPHSE